MQPLIGIDLGGSVITNKQKPYTPRKRVIRRLAQEIKAAGQPVLISHGGGSYSHTSADKYGGSHGYTDTWGFCKIGFDVQDIHTIVLREFIEQGIPVFSFRASTMHFTLSGKLDQSFMTPMSTALEQGIIPVTSGDVIFDPAWDSSILSGEHTLRNLLYALQNKFQITKVIQVGVVDGILDPDGRVVPHLNQANWPQIQTYIYQNPDEIDVTGGMKEKLQKALDMASFIPEIILINGNKPDRLRRALLGQQVVSTLITS